MSVIVPVLDDAARLRRCLSALEDQNYSGPFEVLVVDNGSTDRPDEVVAAFPRARMLREPRRSSYAARNRGAAAARGEVLAFTDSDCVPDGRWLECGVRRLEQEGERAFVGGPVSTFPVDPDRPTAIELYEALHAFPQRRYLESASFSVTANLLVYKRAFADVGEFDGRLESGGDWEWGQRARRAGLRAVYVEDLRVAHPARRSVREMRRKNRRRFAGVAQLRLLGEEPQRRSALGRLVRPPLRSTVRNLRRVDPPTPRSMALYAAARLALHYLAAYQQTVVALERAPRRRRRRSDRRVAA